MKKLFSFLCLLVLGMSMSAWAANPMKRPDKIVLTQTAQNSTLFHIEGPASVWEHSGRSGNCLELYNVDLGSQNALNGSFLASSNTNTHYYYTGDEDNYQLFMRQSYVSFSYVSGTNNSNYVYNVRIEHHLLPDGDGYTYGIYNTSGNGIEDFENAHWDNMPIEIYDYLGNAITIEEAPIALEMDFIYDKSGHNITLSDFSDILYWMYYDQSKRHFFKIVAYDNTKTTNNYVVLCFWMAANQGISYNGTNGPAQKQYDVFLWTQNNYSECDGEGWYSQSCYWSPIGGTYNNYVIDLVEDSNINGECSASSYIADYNNGNISNKREISTIADNVVVRKGAGGNMEVDVRWGSANTITIRELLEDGVITAVPNVVGRGTVTGTIVGSEEAFVSGEPYTGGTKITLTANETNSDYKFLKWNEDSSTENPRTITVNGPATYTAIFTPKCTITVGVDNAEHGTATGSGTYAEGASVNISASGLNGYAFSQWDDGNTNNQRTITVSSSKTTYTASFVLPGMTVGSCDYGADISFHCDYGDIVTHKTSSTAFYHAYDWNGYTRVQTSGNNVLIIATNPDGNTMQLWFARDNDNYTTIYNGGECKNIQGPYKNQTYTLLLAQRYYDEALYDYGYGLYWYWLMPYGANSLVCYNETSGGVGVSNYSAIQYNGTTYKLRGKSSEINGTVTVRENNVGGLFLETENVMDFGRTTNIYFTLGNRSEHPVALGTGTMSVTPSSLTMSAANGSNFASIKLNNNTTGSKTLSDFNIANCSFTYNGNSITEVSDMTGNFTVTNGICTLSLKIRDCKQNLYIVTMSAPAPVYNINYFDKDDAVFSGTQTNAPTTHTFGTATTLKIPTKTGYAFGGWYTASDCGSGAVGNATSASLGATAYTADITLYALWTRKTYTLSATTNPAGLGTVTISPTAPYHYLDEVKLTAPEVTGYTFSGWGGTNSSMMSGDVFTFSADAANNTAYAVTANYTANPYTITLNNQSATMGGTSSQTVDYRTALPDITVPTKTGNAFGGYYTETNGGGTMLIGTDGKWVKNVSGYTDASGNLIHADDFELFAKWTELITFTIADYTNGTVTVTPNDGSGAFTSGSRDLAVGTMVTLNFVAAEHYHISYVTLKGNQFTNGTAYTLQAGDGTVTLTADFLSDTYTLTYRDQGNADYSGSNLASLPASHTYDAATALVDGVKEGYTFNGWYEDAECTGDAVTTIAANSITAAKTLYAKWTKNITYRTLRVNNADHGTVSVAGATGDATDGDGYKTYSVAVGAEVTLNAAVNTDVAVDKYFYEFKNWNVTAGGVTVTNSKFTMPDADVTLSAQLGLQERIVLKDGETDFYGAYSELVTTLKGAAVDVRLDRNGGLKKDRWSTICLPFNYDLEDTYFGGKIWTYQGATGDWENGLDLHFAKTGYMEANTPYLYYNNSEDVKAEDLLFDDVVLTDGTPKDIHGGSVTFKGVVQRTPLTGGENKNKLFLQNNMIYYLGSSGTVVRAYRAYFEVDEQDTPAGMQPRVRIVMHGDNATDMEVIDMDGGTQTRSNAEVRKYMENGILVIEREGVRYDATGAKIN